eukprot:CAMPEP_0172424200 /NCGR_PEP_ID=MMETSP1064-20121228/22691_1 /TAXON_ID=202472 /ORGANISM="Aulacoseira subarctica , Strain CCAP 1002/5" /LENGTH=263 /DNA_ID=CAMNT_0013166047 /DNA_START=141 /DNA_END=928 /DNA_ORIENTATION=-
MQTNSTAFEVRVAKDDFKFNAAHFVAYRGYRERLHGHNYTVSVRLLGSSQISNDGYLLDFGCVKKVTRQVCKELNEHFLCPMLSDVLQIDVEEVVKQTVTITCEDGSVFVFPKNDCVLLPIVHATAEELAVYLWGKILKGLDASIMRMRHIHTLEVTVSESIGQVATFQMAIPTTTEETNVYIPDFIRGLKLQPSPCLAKKDNFSNPNNDASPADKQNIIISNDAVKPPCCKECCDVCLMNQLSNKLHLIADAHSLPSNGHQT